MQSASISSTRVIGLMSGSSLDGLDIACCDFWQKEGVWRFAVPHAACIAYPAEFSGKLAEAHTAQARDLWRLHAGFGRFSGDAVRDFLTSNGINDVTCVASHGHTVFHFPQQGYTAQIGDGAALAARSGLPVICDFRSGDVAKGGQGAPLVPVGDKLLFGDYPVLLNLGGIANATIRRGDRLAAFDICSANQVLNFYARKKGREYDADGRMAASGRLSADLFERLNALEFYAQSAPKSLDNGYTREIVLPFLDETNLATEDILHSYCEHIAYQIGHHLKENGVSETDKMLVTGGGALNTYLLDRIRHHAPAEVVKPDDTVIQYKEALVFAFMGLLRWRGETNIFREVTGAERDSVAGAIYLP